MIVALRTSAWEAISIATTKMNGDSFYPLKVSRVTTNINFLVTKSIHHQQERL